MASVSLVSLFLSRYDENLSGPRSLVELDDLS